MAANEKLVILFLKPGLERQKGFPGFNKRYHEPGACAYSVNEVANWDFCEFW